MVGVAAVVENDGFVNVNDGKVLFGDVAENMPVVAVEKRQHPSACYRKHQRDVRLADAQHKRAHARQRKAADFGGKRALGRADDKIELGGKLGFRVGHAVLFPAALVVHGKGDIVGG